MGYLYCCLVQNNSTIFSTRASPLGLFDYCTVQLNLEFEVKANEVMEAEDVQV